MRKSHSMKMRKHHLCTLVSTEALSRTKEILRKLRSRAVMPRWNSITRLNNPPNQIDLDSLEEFLDSEARNNRVSKRKKRKNNLVRVRRRLIKSPKFLRLKWLKRKNKRLLLLMWKKIWQLKGKVKDNREQSRGLMNLMISTNKWSFQA